MRSNKLQKSHDLQATAPPSTDKIVTNILFDGGAFSGNPMWPDYMHVGGMQAMGNYLAIPLEKPITEIPPGMIVIADITDPENPVKINQRTLNHTAGAVAMGRLQDGKIVLIVGGPESNSELYVYRSVGSDPRDAFEFLDYWNKDEMAGFDWPTGSSGYQTLNLIRQCDGEMFLIGTRSSNLVSDWADLFRVEFYNDQLTLDHMQTRHIYCNSAAGVVCDLAAAGGAYVSPGGELILYGTEHHNDGPNGSVRMGEFRYRDVYSPDTDVRNPLADAGGPWTVPEGTVRYISGSGTASTWAPWVELFEDKDFEDDNWNVVLDWPDRTFDDWNDLDEIEHDASWFDLLSGDGFGDQASAVRWETPTGCNVVLYKDQNFEGDSLVLEGTGEIHARYDLDTAGFGDATHSVRFEGSTCGASADLSYRWDLNRDGIFERSGSTVLVDAGHEDGPSERTIAMAACSAGHCGTDETTLIITNVPPSVSVPTLTDITGGQLVAGVSSALAGTTVFLSAGFYDPAQADTHTGHISWGDGNEMDLGQQLSPVTSDHVFNQPGVYTTRLEVTDDDGGSGQSSVEVSVISAGQSVAVLAEDIATAADDPSLSEATRVALTFAWSQLVGNNDGRAENGALDKLDAGLLYAAMEKLQQAMNALVAAASDEPSVSTVAWQVSVALTAQSIAAQAIASATGHAPPGTDIITQAQLLFDAGKSAIQAGGYAEAVGLFKETVRQINGLI